MDVSIKCGTETHCQLNTKTKAFCSCTNPVNLKAEPEPNSVVCEVCLGLPGSKPAANKRMVELGIKLALALNCRILPKMMFSRKTYFYNDQSKNYQITQYEFPLARGGFLKINANGKEKTIRLRRLHLEEDPAKLVHRKEDCLADYNRAGIPLVEIVTEPDFTSEEEPRIFLQKLAQIMEYLGIFYRDSEAAFKSDLNVSINGGQRVELKNITGMKEIEKAFRHEVIRQKQAVQGGAAVVQETRGWSAEKGLSVRMRAKETEEDYGYITDTDLVAINLTKVAVDRIRGSLPELPERKVFRFIKQYGLNKETAESVCTDIDLANLFEKAAKKVGSRVAGSWISGYLKKSLNWHNLRYRNSGLKDEWIIRTLGLFRKGSLTDRNAEMTIRRMIEEKRPPERIISEYMYVSSADTDFKALVKSLLEENEKAADDFRKGRKNALHFLVGKLIKKTNGRLDARKAAELIKEAVSKNKCH